MTKPILNLLPFFLLQGMKDGEESPNPYKSFIQKLGLNEDLMGRLEKGEDVVEDYTKTFSETLIARHGDQWANDHKQKLEKDIRIGNYKAMQNKLSKAFELDVKDFEGKDKPFEAMLETIAKNQTSKIQSLEEKYKNNSDSTKTQLSAQLDQANQLLKTKEIELAEALAKVQNLPQLIEEGKEEMRKEMFVSGQLDKVLEELRPSVIDAIDKNTLKMIVSSLAKFEAKKEGDIGYSISILHPQTQTPFPKSQTENYKNLGDFIKREVLEKKGWIKKQNPTPDSEGGSDVSAQQKGNKKFKIHQNALKA